MHSCALININTHDKTIYTHICDLLPFFLIPVARFCLILSPNRILVFVIFPRDTLNIRMNNLTFILIHYNFLREAVEFHSYN